jgi:hypothetical protein
MNLKICPVCAVFMFVCSYFITYSPILPLLYSFFSRYLERSEVVPAVPDHVQARGEHAAEVRCGPPHDAGAPLAPARRVLRQARRCSQGTVWYLPSCDDTFRYCSLSSS